jgi:hypothetical protein
MRMQLDQAHVSQFALLSSTGTGDVIPITIHAHSLASLEMFVGVMYLTLVVSRLMGLGVRLQGRLVEIEIDVQRDMAILVQCGLERIGLGCLDRGLERLPPQSR